MEIRGSSFTAFIDVLTNNTYAMIVMSDPNIRKLIYCIDFCSLTLILVESAATLLNIAAAKKHFEKLEASR
jgi:Ras-related GTP-binding protein A/B